MEYTHIVLKNKNKPSHISPDGEKVLVIPVGPNSVLGPNTIKITSLDGYTPISLLAPVPSEVPLWAFRAVAKYAGLFDEVEAAIDSLPELQKTPVQELWQNGNVIVRTSPTLAALATAMGISTAQVDDYFRQAATLVV